MPHINSKSKLLIQQFKTSLSAKTSNINNYVLRPGYDFTRQRKISAFDCVNYTISLGGQSLQNSILDYFAESPTSVSAPAMIYQRSKIKSSFYHDLVCDLTSEFSPSIRYKDYRLLAVDGSTLNVPLNPADVDSYVLKKNGEHKGFNQLHLNAVSDCMTGTILDANIQAIHYKNEIGAARDLLRSTQSLIKDKDKAIYIYDRGYNSYNLMVDHINSGSFFVIRAKNYEIWRTIIDPLLSEEKTVIDITKTILISSISKAKELSMPVSIIPKNKFEFYGDDQMYKLKLRILRFMVGEAEEILITNVFDKAITVDDFRAIYNYRWSIEGVFRKLKYDTNLIYIHSKNRNLQEQEIYGSILVHNICSLIEYFENQFVDFVDKKIHAGRIRCLMTLFIKGRISADKFCKDIKSVLIRSKKGRSFPRNIKGKSFPSNYVRA